MTRLDVSLLAACVVLSCVYAASASSLRSSLHKKRNADTAAQEEASHHTAGEEEEEDSHYIPQIDFDPASPPCISVEYLTEIKDRFKTQIDRNNDGRATFQEMQRYLQDYNPNVREETVAAFIERRDMDGDGIIDFVPEFVKLFITTDHSIENAMEWFNLDDTDGDGYVTGRELMVITTHLGTPEDQARDQVQGYYLSNDKNGDGKLDWDEYKVIYGQ